MGDSTNNSALKMIQSLDYLTMENPHADDPRHMQIQQLPNCRSRFTVYQRCVYELGQENSRCKYQYYRAQIACPSETLSKYEDDWQKGNLFFGLPDRHPMHLRQ
eukprot:GHVS01102687.1.p2 GENE.GHVS01102687.1~~GHVS01102687.1.p2  ORF type:complete len:104 (+),score=7.22 GHVS01102687.1:77-388(+)